MAPTWPGHARLFTPLVNTNTPVSAGKFGNPYHASALASSVVPYVKEAMARKERNLYGKVHAEVDKHLLEYVLSQARENQSGAARLLGINRLTLRKKLGISK